MTADVLKTLLLFAAQFSGYPVSTDMPEVQFVERAWLYAAACHGNPCSVRGLYTSAGIIFLDESFQNDTSAFVKSVVVHEMVHYLQHLSQGPSLDCESVAGREREAYRVQRMYLAKESANTGLLLPRLYCKEQPSDDQGRPVTATIGP